ncbi:MAG: aldehyde dehydrogenase family protein, partial [Nitrospirota bacterium]
AAAKGSENRISFTIREPIGIVCAISPFNFPMNLVCHKIGPAIAAGNSVVLKPASSTPLSAINLAKALIQAGLPKGLLNIVFGPGNTVGEWLLSDQRIGLYTFTGSPKIGKRIKEASGLRRVILELGSNSAAIVHNDADIKKAASACARAGFAYAGQICISLQRLLIHKDIMDKFLSEFIPLVENLKVGNPIDEATDVGPLINEEAAIKAEEWINEAVKNGAKLLTGGKRKGSVVSPAVLTDVERTMRIVCFEAFAPVVSVFPYNTIEEAIDIVNDSEYGLQAGIFTKDINIAFKAIKGIKVGGMMINDTSLYRADMMPYGGVKNSGIGREGPRYAIEEMTDLKTVVINL